MSIQTTVSRWLQNSLRKKYMLTFELHWNTDNELLSHYTHSDKCRDPYENKTKKVAIYEIHVYIIII